MSTDNEHMRLRRRMERRLGRPVSNAAWGLAADERFVAEALDPSLEGGEAGLLGYLRRLLHVEDSGPARPRSRAVGRTPAWSSEDLAARIAVLGRLVAEDAAGDEEILTFRHRVLGRDAPMSADEAEAYLDTLEARRPRFEASFDAAPAGVLKYQNRHVAHDLHVWAGSPLDKLRKLSESLAQCYPWQPAQAAAFVLEGLIPRATPFMVQVPQTLGEGAKRRARVILEVDAWIPAATVLRAYRDVQRQLLPGYNRPVSRRGIDLVNFVLRTRPASWPRLLELWNTEHAAVAYPDYRHMRFAFERARRSILEPAYRPYLGG